MMRRMRMLNTNLMTGISLKDMLEATFHTSLLYKYDDFELLFIQIFY